MTDPGAGGDVVAGRYALVDPIGSGGTGTVWRAWDRQRQQWCAAKVMRQRHSGELLRFAREQSVRLTHPHVASPYAWAADDGTVLIASELVDGGSLHTLVGDYGALDEPTVVVLLDQVLSGLAAVHDAGLVHRDVTPGNVLLRATGDGPLHAMLTDFGLAIGANDARLTGTGMVIGTPGYLPPEVLTGVASPSPQQDVFAVGRLALLLALGQDDPDPRAEAVEDRLARLDDLQLRGAVRAMIEADPTRRPPDASAAARLLAGLPRASRPRTARGDPVTVFDQLPVISGSGPTSSEQPVQPVQPVQPAAPAGPAGPPLRRRAGGPLPAAAAAAALVAVATGVAIALSLGEEPGAAPGRDTITGSASATASSGPTSSATTSPISTSTQPSAIAPGQACGWQEQGDVVDTASGALSCRLQSGAYVWGPSGG